jgi:predicted Zn-dependent protease
VNARYVYVTSYDGDQFDINLLPEDRQAIGAVEDALQKWGKFTLVYEPRQADIVLMVMSRPSEDVLAVYDARGWPDNQYLWRMMGRGGLQPSETPLLTDLEKAFDQATAK